MYPELEKYESYYECETMDGVLFGDEAYDLLSTKYQTMN